MPGILGLIWHIYLLVSQVLVSTTISTRKLEHNLSTLRTCSLPLLPSIGLQVLVSGYIISHEISNKDNEKKIEFGFTWDSDDDLR